MKIKIRERKETCQIGDLQTDTKFEYSGKSYIVVSTIKDRNDPRFRIQERGFDGGYHHNSHHVGVYCESTNRLGSFNKCTGVRPVCGCNNFKIPLTQIGWGRVFVWCGEPYIHVRYSDHCGIDNCTIASLRDGNITKLSGDTLVSKVNGQYHGREC